MRLVSVQPHRLLAVIGEHGDGTCERVTLSHDRKTLASVSFEAAVHLWDVSALLEEEEGDDSAGEGNEDTTGEELAAEQVLAIQPSGGANDCGCL